MAGYQHTLMLHVLVAVVGIGPLAALAVLALSKTERGLVAHVGKQLSRWASASMGLMLLTGIYLLYVTGWGYLQAAWFWVAFVLYLALEPLQRVIIKRASRDDEKTQAASRPLGWVLLVSLIVIVYLMYARP
ncbi:hypothetical protein KQI63_03015 [bacterium]|nr:hypothetical protein [bacterium]